MGRYTSGLRTRVILTYLLIFLVSAAIVAGRAGALFAREALTSAERSLEAQAYMVASALERPWLLQSTTGRPPPTLQDLQAVAGQFAELGRTQITIIDAHGEVLASSTQGAQAGLGGRPEVQAALEGTIQYAVRLDPGTRRPMMYAAAPMQRGGRVLGVVQLSAPLSEVTGRVRWFWLSLGLTVLLAAGIAALAGWLLADQLVRPVARLRDAAGRLAEGNLDERVPPQDTGGVAEIILLAQAFNHMAERVEVMMDRQRAFVANASHELRTPLTNIKLRAEALGNGALDDPKVAHRFIREIEGEADRLGRMASDLLTLSRLDSAQPVRRMEVDLSALVLEAAGRMELRAEKAQVTVNLDLQPGLPTILADRSDMEALVTNLLDNALQYTPPGGNIAASSMAEMQNILLRVSDTGVGIPEEDLPHIFERYYRADKARSRRSAVGGSGAGLGLAIVKGIITAHGGTVEARSKVGMGTTIEVRFPLAPIAEEP